MDMKRLICSHDSSPVIVWMDRDLNLLSMRTGMDWGIKKPLTQSPHRECLKGFYRAIILTDDYWKTIGKALRLPLEA
jgi:hypothetical protein